MFQQAKADLIEDIDAPNMQENLRKAVRILDRNMSKTLVTHEEKQISLTALFDQAFERGMARGPQSFDVLVHPQWPWTLGVLKGMVGAYRIAMRDTLFEDFQDHIILQVMDGWRERFLAEMEELIEKNPNTIIVEPPDADRRYSPLAYDPSQVVRSESKRRKVTPGVLPPDQMPTLMELMNGFHPNDWVRVHGAAYGLCTSVFIRQQVGRQLLGQHLPERYDAPKSIDQSVALVSNAQLMQGNFKDSTIRSGTVFDTISGILGKAGFPGSVEEQTADMLTRIIPNRSEMIEDFSHNL